jgi:Tol biopolymer transport system component
VRGRWIRSAVATAGLGVLLAACGTSSSSQTQSVRESPSSGPSASSTPAASEDLTVRDGEEWIVFQWMVGSGDGIFLIRPDGTGRHLLVPDLEGSEILPDWSPDGQRIAFIHVTPADRNELWVVNADGGGAEMLFSCDVPCNTVTYPDWAPDGSAIYYGMDANAPPGAPPTTFAVGRFDLASGETTVALSREDGMTAEQPRISPDGTQVVYTRFKAIVDEGQGSAIFVSDLAGGPERKLTAFELFGAHPDWAASDLIVFNTYDLGIFQETTEPANLYTIAADGTDLRQLTNYGASDTRATQPRWTPDGSGIVYTQVDGEGFGMRRLAYIGADGSGQRWLTPDPISGTHPQLRPIPS